MSKELQKAKMSDAGDHVDDEFLRAFRMASGTVLSMVLKAAVELDLFEIMAKASAAAANGDGNIFGNEAQKLSSHEISQFLPTKNPEAPVVLDRILRFLASNSILTCSIVNGEDGKEQSLYGLAPICKYFIRDEDGISLAPQLLLLQDKVVMDTWYHLKDAVIEGGVPFNKVYGMHAFEYPAKDSRFNEVFNRAMHNTTTIIMKKILEIYKGFEGIKDIVDVGGGTGATLALIISKYPQIKGYNFDLPHVIKDASPIAGVEHVGGDMFESVPKGEVIFMKWILHDWSDEHCHKLMKNCCNALPESGKVIAVESIMEEQSESGLAKYHASHGDMVMLTMNPGGKERTFREFERLAMEAGFAAIKVVCSASVFSVLEFYKKL